jgi:uncharacterized protein (TIGR03032 family)
MLSQTPVNDSNHVDKIAEIDPAAVDGGAFFSYSPELPLILYEKRCTLAVSTYQAGKLIFVSSLNGQRVRMFGKRFARPMGIAINGNKMAVAGKYAVEVFAKSRGLAFNFPENPKHFDSMYFPQATYHTGFTDMHDLAWGDNGLWAVNTAFSCLVTMDEGFHFAPKWQPPFITELTPEDRCHLNGLAMMDGKPAFVTMLGESDTKEGWRGKHHENGLIMDVLTNEVVLDKLPMPHSPRVHNGCLYFLLSAIGKLMKYDLATKQLTELSDTRSFIRGLDIFENLLFVGTSTIRQSSRSFADLPISKEMPLAGVKILDLNSGQELASLSFSDRIHETFDVKIIPGIIRSTIVTVGEEQSIQGIMMPNGHNFWTREIVKS